MTLTLDIPTAPPLGLLDEPDDEGTRRELLLGGAALALGLAACGDDDEPADGPSRRPIKTPLGPVEVPARARRAVAPGY